MNEELEQTTAFAREMMFLILLIGFSVVVLAASIKLWVENNSPDPPGLYPTLTAGGMLVCCVIAFHQLLQKRPAAGKHKEQAVWDRLKICIVAEVPFTVFIMMVSTVLYVVAITMVGFYPSTFLYMAFSIFFLYKGNRKKILLSLAVSAGFLAAVYLIIQLLFRIRMP